MIDTHGTDHRLVICRDDLAALAMSDNELNGVHRAMRHYDSDSLAPRLLATVEALRAALALRQSPAERRARFIHRDR